MKRKEINYKTNECWLWNGGTSSGLGQMTIDGKRLIVHRVSFELFKSGLTPRVPIIHSCKNKLCFNPEHLIKVTNAELYKMNQKKNKS